jgi:hypothetical protein
MYDVVILIEREMNAADATEVVGLRDQSGEPTRYWVVLPVDDAAARVEASLGTIAANEPFGAAPILLPDVDLDAIQKDIVDSSRRALQHSLQRVREAGGHADGEVTNIDPVDALAKSVVAHQAAEVIVLTRSHLVSEFFHVDWTSKARRRLGVPLLHLVEIGVDDDDSDGDGEDGTDDVAGRPVPPVPPTPSS